MLRNSSGIRKLSLQYMHSTLSKRKLKSIHRRKMVAACALRSFLKVRQPCELTTVAFRCSGATSFGRSALLESLLSTATLGGGGPIAAGLDGCWVLPVSSLALVKRVLGLSKAFRLAFSSLLSPQVAGRFPKLPARVPEGVRFSLSTTSASAIAFRLNMATPSAHLLQRTSCPDAVLSESLTEPTRPPTC